MVQIGLSVARMVGRVAAAEAAMAEAAAQALVADAPAATSLAEAIEADRAAAAAGEARQNSVARAETITGAFARVSRSVRLTVLLMERLDRGWARRGASDDREAMLSRVGARGQIARGVADAIGREADGERAERLTEALGERLERLDVELALAERPVDEVIAEICRDLGLDPARMVVRPPLREAAGSGEAGAAALFVDGGRRWEDRTARRRPDG